MPRHLGHLARTVNAKRRGKMTRHPGRLAWERFLGGGEWEGGCKMTHHIILVIFVGRKPWGTGSALGHPERSSIPQPRGATAASGGTSGASDSK